MKTLITTLSILLITFISKAQQSNKTLQVNGVSRSYIQYLPTGFDPQNESLSLVLVMHGLGGTNSQMVAMGMNNLADTARVMVIYPQGMLNAYGQNSWNNGTLLSSTANDLGLFNQLIDSAILNYNIDPTRVYATGFSMGSIMSYHLACELNDRIAAVGCMSGTMATIDIASCVPTYATPVIHFHGTADATVPYNSGAFPSLSLVPETIDFWKGVHNCANTSDSLRLADLATDGFTVDRFRYDNCTPASSLELWRINGAAHDFMYQPANDIMEMFEIWWFFRKWQHSNPAVAGINETATIIRSIYPNPASQSIQVESKQNASYQLLDHLGNVLVKGALVIGQNELPVSNLAAGIYHLEVGGKLFKIVKL
ncbi:MAG: T9SS type A sorting domain-containing protein [Fluviicola sp.]|nr:T9SS type A sorting domain-containing protein [Fluviicola sp.]